MNIELQLRSKSIEDITILIPAGSLNEMDSCVLRDRMKDLINEGHTKILIDMSDVSFVSSACLGIFSSTAIVLAKKDGLFCLSNVNAGIKKIMEITHLYTKIDVYETREEALAAWQQ